MNHSPAQNPRLAGEPARRGPALNPQSRTNHQSPRRAYRPHSALFTLHSAFTLTEILIVIIIVILILGLALPAFRAITGSRSIEGATNQVAAMLARARADAIGLQIPTGVAFFTDATTGRTSMAEVQRQMDLGFPDWQAGTPTKATHYYSQGNYVTDSRTGYYYVYFPLAASTTPEPSSPSQIWNQCDQYATDIIPGTDVEVLPAGVGAQLVNNAAFNKPTPPTPPSRISDGYVSLGAIMFDQNGNLTSKTISFAVEGVIGQRAGLASISPAILNYPNVTSFAADASFTPSLQPSYYKYTDPNLIAPNNIVQRSLISQSGIVLYDREAFLGNGFDTLDPTYTSTGAIPAVYNMTNEANEETWLDKNSTPLLVNRYNGTLLQSQ